MFFKKFIAVVLLGCMIHACSRKEETCELDDRIMEVDLDLSVDRLEHEFFAVNSVEELLYLMEAHPEFTVQYLQLEKYNSKEELAQALWEVKQDSLIQELYNDVKVHFEDFSKTEADLQNAFKHLKYYFPGVKIPKIYTFVGGFDGDIIVSDDIIVIGLDFFLPLTHRFQPPDLPQYISKRYQEDYIVPMVFMAISSQYNKTDLKENTLISEMIYYGKAYHFTKSMMPCTSDEYIIGYSPEEIAACFANEEFIWAHFIENDLLFETNPFEIRKYTGEAPYTDEISPDAPGRIGRWLGWNIVDDYRFNKSIPIPELMAETNVDKIFRQSGYKPRR
jgi:gliding motility-associated lipoprotein GldB